MWITQAVIHLKTYDASLLPTEKKKNLYFLVCHTQLDPNLFYQPYLLLTPGSPHALNAPATTNIDSHM